MKNLKYSFVLGYIELCIKGENPDFFLETCSQHGICIWDVRRPDDVTCLAKINLSDVKQVKKLRYQTGYKISFINKSGLPFLKKNFFSQKALLIGLVISFSLFLLLTNMIWQVKVTGVPAELEARIYTQLENYGVKEGAFKWNIAAPNEIQHLLIEDLPELLWVGVDVNGTSYQLEAVEKKIVKKEEEGAARHLIASKNGVIKHLFIEKGQANVKVNDVVQRGQLLVSGEIEEKGYDGVDEEDGGRFQQIRAEGVIRAVTWYDVKTTLPLEIKRERLTGHKRNEYKIQVGNVTRPLWPWKSRSFDNEHHEREMKQFSFYKWNLPIKWIHDHIYESYTEVISFTKEEAIEQAIAQAKADLLIELGHDAEILSGKVLHESIDRGKVNLRLYITVEENIATGQPIDQGD